MEKSTNTGYVVFLSVVAALGGILFGYDTAVISGTVSNVASQFGLDSLAQGWYVGCALIGSIFGVATAGIVSDRIGRKPTMLIAAVLFSVSAIGCAVCSNFTQLVVYRIIGGIGIGVVSIVSPMYISEIAVPRWRGTLVSLYQLAITIGFLAAYLINFVILKSAPDVQNGSSLWQLMFADQIWRGMLGAETIPALLFFAVLFFIPESPRWLIVSHRDKRSMAILNRIYYTPQAANEAYDTTASANSKSEKSEWRALLSPSIRRAVLIGVAIAILGQFMGVNAVLYYGPKIFENAGLSSNDALFYQVLVGVANMVTT